MGGGAEQVKDNLDNEDSAAQGTALSIPVPPRWLLVKITDDAGNAR